MERLLVDMDGVMADYDAAALEALRRIVPGLILRPRTHPHLTVDYPEYKRELARITNRPGFFLGLPMIEGVVGGWYRLLQAGFQPSVCTTPPTIDGRRAIEEKRGWLRTYIVPHFGEEVVESLVVTSHKHGVDAFALVDDKPDIPDADCASWEHVVFDQPYNRGSRSTLRIAGWSDPFLITVLQSLE